MYTSNVHYHLIILCTMNNDTCLRKKEKVLLVYYLMYQNSTADHLQRTPIVSYTKYVRDTGKGLR